MSDLKVHVTALLICFGFFFHTYTRSIDTSEKRKNINNSILTHRYIFLLHHKKRHYTNEQTKITAVKKKQH